MNRINILNDYLDNLGLEPNEVNLFNTIPFANFIKGKNFVSINFWTDGKFVTFYSDGQVVFATPTKEDIFNHLNQK